MARPLECGTAYETGKEVMEGRESPYVGVADGCRWLALGVVWVGTTALWTGCCVTTLPIYLAPRSPSRSTVLLQYCTTLR